MDDEARERRRQKLLRKLDTAMTNRNNYESYVQKAENAKLTIELAYGGIIFMNSEQEQDTATKVEKGIQPKQALLNNLGLKYDNSLSSSYESILSKAVSDTETLVTNLRNKLYEYDAQVTNISNELAWL